MADRKLTGSTELIAGDIDVADVTLVVDVSDTADAASGTTKKFTWASVKAALKTYFDTLYNNYVHPNHTGEVTSVADGATTIANAAVTNAKMANMAQNSIKGRIASGAGVPEDLTGANVRTITGLATTDAVKFAQYYSGEYGVTGAGTTPKVWAPDWNNGKDQYMQLLSGANNQLNLTSSNPVADGHYMLIIKQPAGGAAGTLTYTGATILWPGGLAPVLSTSTSPSAVDVISLVYSTYLSAYIGTFVGNVSAPIA